MKILFMGKLFNGPTEYPSVNVGPWDQMGSGVESNDDPVRNRVLLFYEYPLISR